MSAESQDVLDQHFHDLRLMSILATIAMDRPHATVATIGREANGLYGPEVFDGWTGIGISDSPESDFVQSAGDSLFPYLDDRLAVSWYSSPTREHSNNVANPPEFNMGRALIAGSFAVTQTARKPCWSVTFKGLAQEVGPGLLRDSMVNRWYEMGIFTPEDVEGYQNPEDPEVKPHSYYRARLTYLQLMDGRGEWQGQKIPRITKWGINRFCVDRTLGYHGEPGDDPHLHLGLPLTVDLPLVRQNSNN